MSDPYISGEKYCEVYDEPRHRFHLRNDYVNVYEIELPSDCLTHFHRHSEDTVYFVIADADIEESFLDKPTRRTTVSAGGSLCRCHRGEPLIHQVKNIGDDTMHMIGAEALQRPAEADGGAMTLPDHETAWESPRFRVYDVAVRPANTTHRYSRHGLLVAMHDCLLRLTGPVAGGNATLHLEPGAFVWIEPQIEVVHQGAFRGIFAEWR